MSKLSEADEEIMDRLTEYREDVTAISRKPAPKRPWRCPDCTATMSYRHTYEDHLLKHRVGLAPAARKLGQSAGEIRCGVEGCSAAYATVGEADMHRQARHPRAFCT